MFSVVRRGMQCFKKQPQKIQAALIVIGLMRGFCFLSCFF